jgi:ABC-type cobalt transport system substrate-binding protein
MLKSTKNIRPTILGLTFRKMTADDYEKYEGAADGAYIHRQEGAPPFVPFCDLIWDPATGKLSEMYLSRSGDEARQRDWTFVQIV